MELKLNNGYDLFLMLVIVAKITFVIISLRVQYFEHTNSKSKEELSKIHRRQEIIDFFALMLIYILLLYTFFPRRKHLDIIIGHHEQIIFFALGIIGIMHLDWTIPKEIIESLLGKKIVAEIDSKHNTVQKSKSKLN
tara:strand:- start:2296 stop:2706 length:411 start_codon:yes stop_codon:yes gene_type:complete